MSLKERVHCDVGRVFMNPAHFCEEHVLNDVTIPCVMSNDIALKRKNNNVVDLAWDANTTELLFYTPVAGYPNGAPIPNAEVYFDGKPMTLLQFSEDEGLYEILLVSRDARTVQC